MNRNYSIAIIIVTILSIGGLYVLNFYELAPRKPENNVNADTVDTHQPATSNMESIILKLGKFEHYISEGDIKSYVVYSGIFQEKGIISMPSMDITLYVAAGDTIYLGNTSFTVSELSNNQIELQKQETLGALALDDADGDAENDIITAHVRNIGDTTITLEEAYLDGDIISTFSDTETIPSGEVVEVTIDCTSKGLEEDTIYEVKLVGEDDTQLSFSVKAEQILGAMSVDSVEASGDTDQVTVYIRNIGKKDLIINKAYINDKLVADNIGDLITEGNIAGVTITANDGNPEGDNLDLKSEATYEIKIVATDNTQVSFSVKAN